MNESDKELLHDTLMRFFKQRGQGERYTLIALWLDDAPICEQLEYSGDTLTFVPQMVQRMRSYGEVEPGVPALVRVLKEMRKLVGVDVQANCDRLVDCLLNDRTIHWRISHRLDNISHAEALSDSRAALLNAGIGVKDVRLGEGL